MKPGQCGTDPRTQLTPGDQAEVDRFKAYLIEKRDVQPKVVCICGSMRFWDLMEAAAWGETLAGRIVVRPDVDVKRMPGAGADSGLAEAREQLKVDLDQLHRAKIRMATGGILVVGPYIGDSTTAEITYARYLGVPVRFTHPEVDPELEVRP